MAPVVNMISAYPRDLPAAKTQTIFATKRAQISATQTAAIPFRALQMADLRARGFPIVLSLVPLAGNLIPPVLAPLIVQRVGTRFVLCPAKNIQDVIATQTARQCSPP